MISAKTIIDKANEKIGAGLTEIEVTQLSVIDDSLTKSKFDVDLFTDLPSAVDNKGRLAYVRELEQYYFSDGISWIADYNTVYTVIVSDAYSWGLNNVGQLGDGTVTSRLSPVTVIGGIPDWSQLSAGALHNITVNADGIAYAWGSNSSGRLGDGTTANKSSPVTVIGGITDWSQVSAGGAHSLGLTSTSVAYAWGNNSSGRLGDGTTTNRISPVTIVGGITTWSQVSAGGSHSLGLTTNGVAYAWGLNSSGQLGDGTITARSSPTTVVGGITTWSQVSAGGSHSLGLTTNGVAYAWGANLGRLGDGTITARSSPVTVIGGITNWSQLSAGNNHSLGLTSIGIAYAWGYNSFGRLGDGTTANKSSPVTVIGGITNWSRLSGGGEHSLGVTSTGIVYAWGSNGNGRLGDGTTTSQSSPVTVIGGITDWSQVSAGGYHSLAANAITAKGFNEP